MALTDWKAPTSTKTAATLAELALLTGWPDKTLRGWERKKWIKPLPSGRWSPKQVWKIVQQRIKDDAESRLATGSGEEGVPRSARDRKDLATARLAEVKLAREVGKVVDVASVREAFMAVFGVLVARGTGIPGRLAPILEGKSAAEIETILDKELRDVFGAAQKKAQECKLAHPREDLIR